MPASDFTAIEIGRTRVRAIRVRVERSGRASISGCMNEDLPTDPSVQDPAALGRWLGGHLRTAGIPKGRAVLVLPREGVAMKRLTLPTTDATELPDMVRLATQQDLSGQVLVDFVPLAQESSTTVLAVSAPAAVVENAKAVCKFAGLVVNRITVSNLGVLALASETLSSPPGAVLLADVSGESVEVSLVSDGAIVNSRTEHVPAPGDELAMAEAVMTGVRRAWMTHRLGATQAPVAEAILIGRQRVCEYAAQRVQDMLGAPVKVFDAGDLVEDRHGQSERFWPLIGALIEPSLKRATINLASPRRAPDVGATRRRRWLMAAGALIVVGLGLYTLANRDLRELRAESQRLSSIRAGGAADYLRYVRDTYQLKHMRQWESTGVDWLGHADYLSRIAPGPDQVVLDRWTGTLVTSGVQYDRQNGSWTAPRQVTIVIDGEARNRETADSFRETLVQNSLYSTSSTGADARGGKRMPFGFTYRLRTQADAPLANPESPSPTTDGNRDAEDPNMAQRGSKLARSEGVGP